MDKPTCATCPYWDGDEGDEGGECRRRPPRIVDEVVARFRNDIDVDDTRDRAIGAASESYCSFFPTVQSYYWCGEHPDFPAWIESQRKPPQSPPDNPWTRTLTGDELNAAGFGVVITLPPRVDPSP